VVADINVDGILGLDKIGNLSFTFPFTTISLCGGKTTVSETVTL
jgi:hypothetical protein